MCTCARVGVWVCMCVRVSVPVCAHHVGSGPGRRSVRAAEPGQGLRMVEAGGGRSCRQPPARRLCVLGANAVLERAGTSAPSHSFLEGWALLTPRPPEGPHLPRAPAEPAGTPAVRWRGSRGGVQNAMRSVIPGPRDECLQSVGNHTPVMFCVATSKEGQPPSPCIPSNTGCRLCLGFCRPGRRVVGSCGCQGQRSRNTDEVLFRVHPAPLSLHPSHPPAHLSSTPR